MNLCLFPSMDTGTFLFMKNTIICVSYECEILTAVMLRIDQPFMESQLFNLQLFYMQPRLWFSLHVG